MPDRFIHLVDATITGVVTLVTTMASSLLIVESLTQQVNELRLLFIPLIGGLIMSGGLILLAPSIETRRVTVGRAIIGLFFGSALPSLAALIYPPLEHIVIHPVALLIGGGLATGFFFVLSRPFVRRFYHRSDDIAKDAVDAVERETSKHLGATKDSTDSQPKP